MTQATRPSGSKVIRAAALSIIMLIAGLMIYYLIPAAKIPDGVIIDRMVVRKSEHKLEAYSGNKLIVVYKIAIGKNPVGPKQYEGDQRTPEGRYTINDRNPRSGYHRNLGISYPNTADIERAKALGRPAGGDVKIHSLKNGQGYIGKFHRWKDWTNGCIAVTDEEMDELYKHTALGAVIDILK